MSNLATSTTVNRSNTVSGNEGFSSWVQRYNSLILGNSSGTVLTLSISRGPDSIVGMLGCPEDKTFRLLNLCCSHFFPKVRGSIRRIVRMLIYIVTYSLRESFFIVESFCEMNSLRNTFADCKSSPI